MKKQIYSLSAFTAMLLAATPGHSQFVIDDFTQATTSQLIVTGSTPVNFDFVQTHPSILGGQRDIRLTNYRQMNSTSGCSLGVSGGFLDQNNGPGAYFNDFILTYDGNDDNNAGTIDATTGLGGLDLSGNTSFKTTVAYADPQAGISVMFRVYSSPTHYSEGSFTSIPSSFSSLPNGVEAAVSMANFSTGVGATNPADFTAVTAIQVIFKTPGNYGGFDWSWSNGVEVPSIFIAGNVYNDGNGMTNNLVDGTPISTVESAQLYANLINPVTGTVIASAPVKTDGSYRFDFVKSDATYQVQLSTNQGIAIGAMPATALSTEWRNTGEHIGLGTGSDVIVNGIITVSVGNSSIENVNFGINKMPSAEEKTYNFTSNPPANTTIPLNGTVSTYGATPGLLSGDDREDGALGGSTSKFVINALPTNGTLLYNGSPVTAAQVSSGFEFTNPALLSFQFTGSGYSTTTFSYSFVDNAGFKGTPANYTIVIPSPLPVSLLSFDVVKNGKSALLTWATATENNNEAFYVERSANGRNWTKIGAVSSLAQDGNSNEKLDYSFTDEAPLSGINMYQLKQVNIDGKYEYSTTRTIRFDNNFNIKAYPNPVSNKLTIEGLTGEETVSLYDFTGKKISTHKANGNRYAIDMSTFAPATYSIIITDTLGNTISSTKVVKNK